MNPAVARDTTRARDDGGLDVRAVSKRFGATAALDDVSLAVAPGRFVTLLGPSGCGKTTLLRILAGLEVLDSGTVHLDGQRLDLLPAHRRPVNTVFQSYALFPHLDVTENVSFGLRARRRPSAEIARRVAEAIELLRLEGLERRSPAQLSGGQRQRVALARALVNEPALLLLDEPMSALDAKLRVELQVELRALQRRLGTTFLLVTHDQDEALTVSDRVFVMEAGRIAQHGTPDEVYDSPRSRFVAAFVGAANLIAATARDGGPSVETALGPLELTHPPPWRSGTLAIRPERVRIAAGEVTGAPAVNRVRTTVADRVFRGDHCDLILEPGALRVRLTPARPVPAGAALWVELPPADLKLLDD